MHDQAVDPDADGQNVSGSSQKNQVQDSKIRYALARDPMAKSSTQLFAIIDAGFANATYEKIANGAIDRKWNVPPSKQGIGFSLVSASPSKDVIPLKEKVLNRDELKDLSSLPPFLSAPGSVLASYTASIAKQPGPKGIQEYFRYSNKKSPFPDYLDVQKNLDVNISDSNEKQSLSPLEFLETAYLKKQYPFEFTFASNNLPQKSEEVEVTLVPASATRARLFITRFTQPNARTKGYELACQTSSEKE